MSIKDCKFQRPDPDSEFEDILVYDEKGTVIKEPAENEPRTVYCCQCNTTTSWCIPEQISGAFFTSTAAQGLSFWFS